METIDSVSIFDLLYGKNLPTQSFVDILFDIKYRCKSFTLNSIRSAFIGGVFNRTWHLIQKIIIITI